jgi:ABC-type Zn uptake system ZnuABC Zn-binding protein ZnuA
VRRCIATFLLVLGLFSWGYGRVKVVATIQPLGLLVKDVGGDAVEVHTLLPPGASVHAWELRLKDALLLRSADLVVAVGCGAEPWLSTKGLKRMWYLCDGLKLKNGNPHVWISFDKVIKRLGALAGVLGTLAPQEKEKFLKKAHRLQKELCELKETYRKELKGISVVSQHGAWVYLFDELDINYLGALEPAPHREPGPRRLALLIGRLKSSSCPVMVSEFGHNPKFAEFVARKSGACLARLYPLGKTGLKSFVEFLKLNLRALVRCRNSCTR